LVIGTWGAVQATSAGAAMALGGALRDGVSVLAMSGALGEVLVTPITAYSFVYHLEMYLLFVVLVALGPMLRASRLAARAEAQNTHTPPTLWPGTTAGLMHRFFEGEQPWKQAQSHSTSMWPKSCCTCSGHFLPG
jgi:hypothetical protein